MSSRVEVMRVKRSGGERKRKRTRGEEGRKS